MFNQNTKTLVLPAKVSFAKKKTKKKHEDISTVCEVVLCSIKHYDISIVC